MFLYITIYAIIGICLYGGSGCIRVPELRFLGIMLIIIALGLSILMFFIHKAAKETKAQQADIILTDIETVVAVCNYKEKFANAAKPIMTATEYDKFQNMLEDLNNSLTESYIATLNSVQSLQIEKRALSPKLDPAIMGGLADGIAGPAAGVYTALSVAEANAEIDAVRREASANARNATSYAERTRLNMFYKYKEVFIYIKQYSQLMSLHNEALSIKRQEKQAERDAKEKTDRAATIFTIIVVIIVAWIIL